MAGERGRRTSRVQVLLGRKARGTEWVFEGAGWPGTGQGGELVPREKLGGDIWVPQPLFGPLFCLCSPAEEGGRTGAMAGASVK